MNTRSLPARRWRRYAWLLAIPVVLGACNTLDPAPADVEVSEQDVDDGAHDGLDGFYFLPPMVPQPSHAGDFDAGLAPAVEICSGVDCTSLHARYTMVTGPGSETVRVSEDDENYIVNWHTDDTGATAGASYRVRVMVGDIALGFADVEIVSNGKEARNVDTDELIALVDGRTLPIKFRIETSVIGSVAVQPDVATIGIGETRQFTATLYDLHGSERAGPDVSWSVSDGAVATVDDTGLASSLTAGSTAVVAAVGGTSGSGVLHVEEAATGTDFVQVVPGNDHTCALTANASTYCWGFGGRGQIGNGATDDHSLPEPVVGGQEFVTLGGGGDHTCGLTSSGAAYCWGNGGSGQLGNGESSNQSTPVAVAGSHDFTALSAGAFSTCAIDDRGAAYCWGSGQGGALGNGSTTASAEPVAVLGGHTFESISVGRHACGITTARVAFCWGEGAQGQLGDGGTSDRLSPVRVAGDHAFLSIAAGHQHTCAIATDDSTYCWGSSREGQLGTGSNTGSATPAPVVQPDTFTAITAGIRSTCGLASDGAAYCWGSGTFGRLGTGSADDQVIPTPVAGGQVFTSVRLGGAHGCGTTTSDGAYCWGLGNSGQLGTGNTRSSSIPVSVVQP